MTYASIKTARRICIYFDITWFEYRKDIDNQNDWGLNITDHDGNNHIVYLEPGEMILYESAICEHGRIERWITKNNEKPSNTYRKRRKKVNRNF